MMGLIKQHLPGDSINIRTIDAFQQPNFYCSDCSDIFQNNLEYNSTLSVIIINKISELLSTAATPYRHRIRQENISCSCFCTQKHPPPKLDNFNWIVNNIVHNWK